MLEDSIFADSLLENVHGRNATRRSWTTLTSFGLQILGLGCFFFCLC